MVALSPANVVVNDDVPSGVVMAGVPAHIVKELNQT
jgi:serine acetyltransferase